MGEIDYERLLRRIEQLEQAERSRQEAERRGRSTDGRAEHSLSRAFRRVGWNDAALYHEDSPEGQRERERIDRLMKYVRDGGDLGG